MCDACFFDTEFSNAQSVIAEGEAADVLISADELFPMVRLL